MRNKFPLLIIYVFCISLISSCNQTEDQSEKKERFREIVDEYGFDGDQLTFGPNFVEESTNMEELEQKLRHYLDSMRTVANEQMAAMKLYKTVHGERSEEMQQRLSQASTFRDTLLIELDYPDLVTFKDSSVLRNNGIIK